MQILSFSFFVINDSYIKTLNGGKVKRGVDFRHFTRVASRVQQKMGNGMSTLIPQPIRLCAGYSVILKNHIAVSRFTSHLVNKESSVKKFSNNFGSVCLQLCTHFYFHLD